jgi:hypothetical protein
VANVIKESDEGPASAQGYSERVREQAAWQAGDQPSSRSRGITAWQATDEQNN